MVFVRFETRVPLVFLSIAALGVAACGDDDPQPEADASTDAGSDVGGTPDVGERDSNPFPDLPYDLFEDSTHDVTPDSETDSEPDAIVDTAPDVPQGPLVIVGDYDDGFGGFVRVTEEFVAFSWYGNDIAITRHNNDEGWLVGQNSPDDPWSPNLWSRIEWIAGDATVFWCQTQFSAATEEEARLRTDADREDLDAGCAGFPWSRLTPGQGPIAILGEWTDAFGGTHTINNERWIQQYPDSAPITFNMSAWENASEVAFAQNSLSNEWSPGLWSRFDWIWDEGAVWYCQTVFDAESEEAARAADAADAADPATGGCGGAPWTELTAAEPEG